MKKISISIIIILIVLYANAQSGAAINTTGAAADPSAILDVSSTSQGFLIPRISLAATISPSPVSNPANGLMVYNTATVGDVSPGFYYWDGIQWVQLATGATVNTDLRAIKTKIYTNMGGH